MTRAIPALDPEIDAKVTSYINGLAGQPAELSVDRDFLLQPQNIDLFMLNYFPRDFTTWEPLNKLLIDFLENNREGVAWLPGGHGKTTTLLRWKIRGWCVEPQLSFIYVEKNEPVALSRSRAIMGQLEGNKKLIHDFGDFKGEMWSANSFTIAQRPFQSDWPSLRVFGTGGAALGNRCNIMIVDDPVTTHNSASEAERATIYQWFSEAAATCPYPLPLSDPNSPYLKKLFLVGTTFHMDDLYHQVLARNPGIPHLHLRAVDLASHECLSQRFAYREPSELERSAESSREDQQLLRDIEIGKVTNLFEFRKTKGIIAFNRRYQNEVIDPETQVFSEVWFRGGSDQFAMEGGYPGCFDKERSLGDAFDGFRYVTGYDPASGSATKNAARSVIVTLGAHPNEPETIHLMDIDFGHFPMELDNPNRRTQLGLVIDHVRRYGSSVALETNNIQKALAGSLRAYAQRQGMVVTVNGHWTSKKGKLDPEMGVEAMAPMFENGKIRLPYREPEDVRKMEELLNEFIGFPNVYPTTDIIMAVWFAWRVLKRKLKRAVHNYQPQQAPAYIDYFKHNPAVIFPEQWTKEQQEAYIKGTPQEDDEEEEVAL